MVWQKQALSRPMCNCAVFAVLKREIIIFGNCKTQGFQSVFKKWKTCSVFLLSYEKHEWKFGRKRNAVGTSRRRVFPQLFRVLPNFRELENTATKKKERKQLVTFDYQFSLLAPSLHQQLVLVLCFYRVLVQIYQRSITNAVR